jgi:hypothetical protein
MCIISLILLFISFSSHSVRRVYDWSQVDQSHSAQCGVGTEEQFDELADRLPATRRGMEREIDISRILRQIIEIILTE